MTQRLSVAVAGIGLVGPGLIDWTQGRQCLADSSTWQSTLTRLGPALRLDPTDRRRAGLGAKASVAVADQACTMAGVAPKGVATVFSSSTGDPTNCHALCEALASPARLLSPTRFTNSVHNASAGYWHIALRSMEPSTSLAAFDGSVAAGLLEAAVQLVASASPVLFVGCDLPYPEPLNALRPMADLFAFALLLVPSDQPSMATLALSWVGDATATPCTDPGLERLRVGVPAARALPLLQALAQRRAEVLVIGDQPGMAIEVSVVPLPDTVLQCAPT